MEFGGFRRRVRVQARRGERAHLPQSLHREKVYAHTLKDVSSLASPVATADGRIYFVGSAKGYVVKAGPKFEIIGGGHLGGYDFGAGALLAVSAGRIYVRDGQSLYCIGKK